MATDWVPMPTHFPTGVWPVWIVVGQVTVTTGGATTAIKK